MLELALHILDIAENSSRAGASRIEVTIVEDTQRDVFVMEVADNGSGMDEETRSRALDPFFTTKKVRRVGLGLPMLKEAAERAGGEF
ncbi:MAG TPA: ATP-binding protein, partial [Deltaproteobacteria bacterium]|nr:ATP-binding protein [Deltaproteobacteria bacterium]